MKDILRTIAFVGGCACILVSVGLLALVFVERNPYSESDARPFSIPIKLDGSETHTEITSTTNENYALSIKVNLPAEAKVDWVRFSCLMGSAPLYYTCNEMGHLRTVWTVSDTTDGSWHDWEVNSNPHFEVTTGIGEGVIGWFRPVRRHHYVVTIRAVADVPAIRQSPASLYAYFADEVTQGDFLFGNLFALVWAVIAVPFVLVGLPWVLIFWPRQKRSPIHHGDAGV